MRIGVGSRGRRQEDEVYVQVQAVWSYGFTKPWRKEAVFRGEGLYLPVIFVVFLQFVL